MSAEELKEFIRAMEWKASYYAMEAKRMAQEAEFARRSIEQAKDELELLGEVTPKVS